MEGSDESIIRVKLMQPGAMMPTRSHKSDGGADLYSYVTTTVFAGETQAIPTGIAVDIPEGMVGLIKGRSGLSKGGLDVYGGVIDSGYKGEIKVLLHNSDKHGKTIQVNDRIAQLVIVPVSLAQFVQASTLGESPRGDAGFGSTGK